MDHPTHSHTTTTDSAAAGSSRFPTRPRDGESRSIGSLIKEIRDETTQLFRQEALLAKTEISEKISRMTNHAGVLAAGAMLAFAGLVVLLISAGEGVAAGLIAAGMEANALWLGPLIVGLLATAIGLGVMLSGKQSLQHESLVPEKTAESLKENKEWLKNKAE